MRQSQSYLWKFILLIALASLTFNIFFLTTPGVGKKWMSSNSTSLEPSQVSQMIWPPHTGPFTVLFDYVPRVFKYNSSESITFSTHATPDFLYHLNELVPRWQGPISIAVYTPGSDVDLAIQIIQHLHRCAGKPIRNYVSFHLFFQKEDSVNDILPFSNYSSSTVNCSSPINKLVNKTYRYKRNITYPVNVARNIARRFSSTRYVLTCDLELYPSLDLIPMFLQMTQKESPVESRRVYVLPVYEVESAVKVPGNKRELVKLVREKKAVSFHRYMCTICHQIPNEEKWLNASSNNSLEVFSVVDKRPKNSWEPIFIGTNEDPLYDERLSWEGMSDKLTQLYEMCLMNYKLHILDDAFLVHAPGIKRDWKKYVLWRKKYINERLKAIKIIKADIDKRHPKNKNCTF